MGARALTCARGSVEAAGHLEFQGQICMARGPKPILTAEDFPLVADECRMFARTRSEPILLALDSRMAAEIAERPNCDCKVLGNFAI